MNRYNDQLAKAREVADLLRKPGMRDRFEQELKRFRDWYARWERAPAKRLGQYSALADQGQIPEETQVPEEEGAVDNVVFDHLAREREERAHGLEPVEPDPWDYLLKVPEQSEMEHTTEMLEFFVPTEVLAPLDLTQALCLQYVRLAILHDMALRTDGARQPITAGILDSQKVKSAWEQITGRNEGGDSWESWRTVLDQALQDVAANVQGEAPEIEEYEPHGERPSGNPDDVVLDANRCGHNEEFTNVMWYGTEFVFNSTQAAIVKILWPQDTGKPGKVFSSRNIGLKISSNANRFRPIHAFRVSHTEKTKRKKEIIRTMHPAWGRMIQRAGKDQYHIAPPVTESI